MTLKCLIVDDEAPARDELVFFLSKIAEVEVVGEADSARHAFEKIREFSPDVVFLDIEMPGNSGFFLVEQLKELEKRPHVVFATAYNQYAVKAFEADAADYILKPFSFDRIRGAVEKVQARVAGGQQDLGQLIRVLSGIPEFSRIPLERNGRTILVLPEDIFFFEASGKEITAQLDGRAFFLPREATMDKLEKRLAFKNFFRSHRSYLVNLNQIQEFYPWSGGKYELVMKNRDHTKVPVSRTRVRAFKDIVSAW